MNRWLKLIRVGNCIMSVFGVLAGMFIAVGLHFLDYPAKMVTAMLVGFFIPAASNSLNDFLDRENDKINHPERPIPSGLIMPKHALQLSIFLFVLGNALSLTLPLYAFLIVLSASLLMIVYESKLKKKWLIGNMVVSIATGEILLFGSSVFNKFQAVGILFILIFFISLGREIIKSIEDLKGDTDRVTLPAKIGTKNAGIIACIAIIIGIMLSPLPYYLYPIMNFNYIIIVIAANIIFIISCITISSNPHRAQKLIKAGMLVALIAFIVGKI